VTREEHGTRDVKYVVRSMGLAHRDEELACEQAQLRTPGPMAQTRIRPGFDDK